MDAEEIPGEQAPEGWSWPRAARIAIPIGAILIVVLGTAMLFVAQSEASFGWFAYAPLSSATFVPQGLVYLGSSARLGMALCAVGLVLLAFWAGYQAGRSRRSRRR
jgi:heme/copper-type cytochrome/quinol oxidase subunit 1